MLAWKGCQLFHHHIVKAGQVIVDDKLATPRNKVNFSAQIIVGKETRLNELAFCAALL